MYLSAILLRRSGSDHFSLKKIFIQKKKILPTDRPTVVYFAVKRVTHIFFYLAKGIPSTNNDLYTSTVHKAKQKYFLVYRPRPRHIFVFSHIFFYWTFFLFHQKAMKFVLQPLKTAYSESFIAPSLLEREWEQLRTRQLGR